MKSKKSILVAAGTVVAIALSTLLPATAASAAPTVDVINVRDYGAVGNGTTDDTAAFKSAITASTSQRRPVYVPYGEYKISQKLTLTDQLMFGEPNGSWSSDNKSNTGAKNPTLPTINVVSTTQSAVSLGAGGSISGLNFEYVQNHSAATPTTYPATVLLSGVGTRISNVRINNAWIAIDTDPATDNTGRAVIQDVFISNVAKMGIHLDKGWDATTVDNVEIWTPNVTYQGYFLANGTGMLLEHNDALRVTNTFVFGANTGILTRNGAGGSGTWGTFVNTSTDFCSTGVRMEGENHLTVSGGSYWSHNYAFNVQGAGSKLNISSAHLKGNGAPALLINDASWVTVGSSTIQRTHPDFQQPAVEIAGGWNVVINGNYITGNKYGVRVGSSVNRLILSDNIIEPLGSGKVGITNNAPASPNILIVDNVVV